MSFWSLLVTPFSDYAFMRSALVACMALAVASGPLGTLLLLRRMGLVGDVLSHAVMPGAAIAFALAGSALAVLSAGGLITGIAVVALMILGTRFGAQREDASLAAFYFASIGVGVLIVSLRGTNLDLMHVLLGTVLAIDIAALRFQRAGSYQNLKRCFRPQALHARCELHDSLLLPTFATPRWAKDNGRCRGAVPVR